MRTLVGTLAALCLATSAAAQTAPATPPQGREQVARLQQVGAAVLFWSQEQRDRNFPAMETLFPTHVVARGETVHALPAGTPLPIAEADVEAFMAGQNTAGLIVVQDGKIRLERYARGYGPEGRWTSFSVAKSFTSTLVGAALRDGAIASLDDPVTKYIPELAGGGYDGVTVAQLLTMTSGVAWNEDYTDPKSDVARMFAEDVPAGEDPTVHYMRKLPREAAPGTKWVYKTGETNLVGVLVRRATGKSLADYLAEKVWIPYGMEQPAAWMLDQSGAEVSGCCLSVSLRDYARFGQFVLDGGKGVVPDGWFADATRPHAVADAEHGVGYGYQWWTLPGGRFAAFGIFGQTIYFNPQAKLIVAVSSAWPKATGPELSAARTAFLAKLEAAAAK